MAGKYVFVPCKVCGEESKIKGLCAKHYLKLRRYGDPTHTARPHDWGTKLPEFVRKLIAQQEVFESLHKKQGGVCAICGLPETSKNKDGKALRLSIDHCHKTGSIRGLLCSKCNRGLGCFNDETAFIEKAKDYLLSNNGKENAPTPKIKAIEPIRLCSVKGCERIHDSFGYCAKHA